MREFFGPWRRPPSIPPDTWKDIDKSLRFDTLYDNAGEALTVARTELTRATLWIVISFWGVLWALAGVVRQLAEGDFTSTWMTLQLISLVCWAAILLLNVLWGRTYWNAQITYTEIGTKTATTSDSMQTGNRGDMST